MSISSYVTLTIMTCGNCGVEFAMPETMRAEKERDGGSWYCPNGHNRVYKETEATKYKRLFEAEQERARKRQEELFAEQREHEKTQRKVKKLARRVSAGVCPCCKRTFSQLARHMKAKHSDAAETL